MSLSKRLPPIVVKTFQMLEEKGFMYAVLRNYEGLPFFNKSRDVDILIKSQDYPQIRMEMEKLCEKEHVYIISYFESERLRTFICGTIIGENVELIQLDFFVHTSAYGHIILTGEEILLTREFSDGIYHASKVYQFLDKYLYLKYIGAKYPSKYNALKEEVSSSIDLVKILSEFGISRLQELDDMSTREFRKRVKHRNKNSFKTILLFWKYYILNCIQYKGYSIGFTGPDGSGKTTVISNLCEKYSAVYSRINIHHFRPNLFKNLGEMAYNAKLKKSVDKDYNKPHRGGKVGKFNSLLRLIYYSVDYLIGYFVRIRRILQRRELVVFDRYFTDIICDSRRSRIYLPHKFLYWFGRLFIPSLDYNILLTANAETILLRKQELDSKGIEAINAKINYLANKKGYYRILNNGTPQEAVAKILRIVFQEQHKKNIKRLK